MVYNIIYHSIYVNHGNTAKYYKTMPGLHKLHARLQPCTYSYNHTHNKHANVTRVRKYVNSIDWEHNWDRHVTVAYLKNRTWYIVFCKLHNSWGRRKKLWFLHPLGSWKMHFPKPEKYSIINKSATFVTFCHPFLKPLTFASFLHKFEQWKF